MKRALATGILVFACAFASAPANSEALSSLSAFSYPVGTTNPAAQNAFDQGLLFHFAHQRQAAENEFQQALRLDPAIASAAWGEALAAGPAVDEPMSVDDQRSALVALKQAEDLYPRASHEERLLIRALTKRYSSDPRESRAKLDAAYRDAMLAAFRQYPDDPVVGALTAEAQLQAMDLANAWDKDGVPSAEMLGLRKTLDAVLTSTPNNPGANVVCVLAYANSPDPVRGLPCASHLSELAALPDPGDARLFAFANRIYQRVGNWQAVVTGAERAINADTTSAARSGVSSDASGDAEHDAEWLIVGALRVDDHSALLAKGGEVLARANSPLLDLLDLRRNDLSDVLARHEPRREDTHARMIFLYTRAMALAKNNNVAAVAEQLKAFDTLVAGFKGRDADVAAMLRDTITAYQVKGLGDSAHAIASLHDAIRIADRLGPEVFPEWADPVHEQLAALLLDAGRPGDAEEYFREELRVVPRDPHALRGLEQSLRAEDRADDAAFVRAQWRSVWRGTSEPSISEL
ncbi:MAG TPA: hypothetical protein VGZ00_02820 [Candidatus Baltobacteraceae bacterium]|jgi:tetratricopeptide (TPR) repeat protein|nr:hypothetical protein [Candidatus Baltobacteraceae bacterium]